LVLKVSKIIRVRYEKGVLRPLKPLGLREGEEVKIRIEESIREKLKDLIGILGESSEEELERYLEEAWTT
jgi:predicted DNA-binding antitoxin AbrB/MazE fold protein